MNFFNYISIGTKNIQEDKIIKFEYQDIKFFFILDAHGTKEIEKGVISFFDKNDYFKNKFIKNCDKFDSKKDLIKITLNEIDKDLISKKMTSGTCLVGLIQDSKKTFVFNIGDCQCYVFEPNLNLVFKTPLHNLNNIEEKKRIIEMGYGRFINNNRYKNLSITRTLGDYDCREVVNDPIISKPFIQEFPNNMIFFLCSDGIRHGYDIDYMIYLFKNKFEIKLENYCQKINTRNKKISNEEKKVIDNVAMLIYSNELNKSHQYGKNKFFDNLFYFFLKRK